MVIAATATPLMSPLLGALSGLAGRTGARPLGGVLEAEVVSSDVSREAPSSSPLEVFIRAQSDDAQEHTHHAVTYGPHAELRFLSASGAGQLIHLVA